MKFFSRSGTKFVPFRYSGFHDVPRDIVFKYQDKWFYLASPFDEIADEYPSEYSVFLLPGFQDDSRIDNFWDFAGNPDSMLHIGMVLIDQVHFDSSKRKELDPSFLDQVLPQANRTD